MKEIMTDTIIGALVIMAQHYRESELDPIVENTLRLAIKKLTSLNLENKKLKGELPAMRGERDVQRYRLVFDPMEGIDEIGEDPNGEYVKWDDCEWMANYADRLVAFANLPCLPADLENLRRTNENLAAENFELQQRLNA